MQSRFTNSRSLPSGRPRGFTLIELLVVMSIIMILASILFPSFARARGMARQVYCASNLRQCGMALRMYQDDWDDYLPAQDFAHIQGYFDSVSPRTMSGPEDVIWIGQLYSYLKTTQVMRCKEANYANVDRFNGQPVGIGINVLLTYQSRPGGASGNITWYSPSVNSVSDPTGSMVLADCSTIAFVQTADGMMNVAYANAKPGTYAAGQLGEDRDMRHVSGSNVVFADGHVKCYSPVRLLSEIEPLQ